MTIPQQAVEAAATAMSKASSGFFSGEAWRFLAQDALEAALPALEQQIREQIKQELVKAIDDLDSSKTDNAYAVMFVTQGLEYAYRIVHRGESA